MRNEVKSETLRIMTVYFIGAGPGAADLITIRGRDLIAACAGLPLCRFAGANRNYWNIARKGRTSSTPPPCTLDEIEAEIVKAHAKGT